MSEPPARYVPAAGRPGLTGVYDAALALTMREGRWRPLVVDRAVKSVPAGGRVVDVGTGTGTLAIALAAARPDVEVVAVDGDPKVLQRARTKAGAGTVEWRTGLAWDLRVDDAGADAAVMSLLLHHLVPDDQRRALREVRRVLRPGGRLLVADWGRPHDRLMRAASHAVRLLDGAETTRDHLAGRLAGRVLAAGFEAVDPLARLRTVWGSLDVFEARVASVWRVSAR